MKKLLVVCIIISIFLCLYSGCDSGLVITDIDIITYPDKLIYIVGEDVSLNLSGGVVRLKTREGSTTDVGMRAYANEINEPIRILHNINFKNPGVYTVLIVQYSNIRCSFPIQVIE